MAYIEEFTGEGEYAGEQRYFLQNLSANQVKTIRNALVRYIQDGNTLPSYEKDMIAPFATMLHQYITEEIN